MRSVMARTPCLHLALEKAELSLKKLRQRRTMGHCAGTVGHQHSKRMTTGTDADRVSTEDGGTCLRQQQYTMFYLSSFRNHQLPTRYGLKSINKKMNIHMLRFAHFECYKIFGFNDFMMGFCTRARTREYCFTGLHDKKKNAPSSTLDM